MSRSIRHGERSGDADNRDGCVCEVDRFTVAPISTIDRVVDPVTGLVTVERVCFFVAYFRHNDCCDCCEFRQYVYTSTATIDGVPILSVGGVMLDGLGVYEDVDANGRAYGHREDPAQRIDRYVPDQSNGCIYVGRDYPGLHDVPAGITYDINFHFLDVIVDTCNDEAIVAGPQFWDMVASGTT